MHGKLSRQRNMEKVNCSICNKEIYRYPYQLKKHKKFHCKGCSSIAWKRDRKLGFGLGPKRISELAKLGRLPEGMKKGLEKGRGWMKGKHLSLETKKKLSDSLKKRVFTKEAWKNMMRGLEKGRYKGKHHTEEAKRKISKGHKGKLSSLKSLENLKNGREKHSQLIKQKDYWTEEKLNVLRKNGKNTSKKMAELKGKTTPERKLSNTLDNLKVNHISQYPFHYYLIDEYIPDRKLAIEIDGKYWHNYPFGRTVDRRKDGYLKYHGINVLRIWENEIYKVKEYFNKKGGEKDLGFN